MKKPTEKQIEKFVRFPEELSSDELIRIKKAVKEDRELKMLRDWFAIFYEEMLRGDGT